LVAAPVAEHSVDPCRRKFWPNWKELPPQQCRQSIEADPAAGPSRRCASSLCWCVERDYPDVILSPSWGWPAAAGHGEIVPEAKTLNLALDVLPVLHGFGEDNCVTALKVRQQFFVAQGSSVCVSHAPAPSVFGVVKICNGAGAMRRGIGIHKLVETEVAGPVANTDAWLPICLRRP